MRIAALGRRSDIEAFEVGGITLLDCDDDQAEAVWEKLDDDIGLLITTHAASAVLRARFEERPHLLVAVMPE
jgi:hypothetical protein